MVRPFIPVTKPAFNIIPAGCAQKTLKVQKKKIDIPSFVTTTGCVQVEGPENQHVPHEFEKHRGMER